MAQSSLGEMIIRIVGDTALFDSSVDKSKITLDKFYKELEKADAEFKKLEDAAKKADLEKNLKLKESIDKTKQLGGDLTKYVTLPIVALGTLAIKSFADSVDAEAKFNAALMATGKQSEINVNNFKALTAELQKTTIFEDDAQLAALGLVQSLANLNESGLKALLPRMLDFSAAMGVDLQTTASLFGKTLGSTTNALGRYGIQIDDSLTGEDRLLALTKALDSKFKDYAETTAKLGTGPMKQLLNTLGDLGESFGEVILPVINELIPPIKEAIIAFGNLDSGTKKTIVVLAALAAAVGPVLSVGAQLISVVTTIGTSFAAIGAVGGPILVVAAAIGFTALEMAKYKKNTDETIAIQQGFIKVMNESKQSIDQFKDSFLVFETSPIILKNNIAEVDKQISNLQANINNLKKNGLGQEAFNFQNLDFTGKNNIDPLAKQRQEVFRLQEELKKLQAVREKLIEQQSKVGPIEEKTITNTKTQTELQSYLIDRQETELDILGKTIEAKGMLLGVNDILGTQTSEILYNAEQEAKAFNELYESYSKYTSLVVSSTGPIFEAFGAALVKGEEGWKAFAKAGVDAIASIIDALSNEALVQAAKEVALSLASAASLNSVGAAAHGASAAAWGGVGALGKVVAGVIRAIPMQNGGLIMPSPGGTLVQAAEAGVPEYYIPERDDIMSRLANRITSNMQQPINNTFSPNINNSINGPMVLSIDGQQFKAYINQQSAKGNIQISRSRGISRR